VTTAPEIGDLFVADTILPAVAGDTLRRGDGQREYVLPRCTCRVTRYGCVTCGGELANTLQVAFHVERGCHVIAGICKTHGAVEPL
jgi:hypothetical protein